MDYLLKKRLLRLILSLHFVTVVFCDTNFELKLISFSNPSGKDDGGQCCESFFGGSCSSNYQCDPQLNICIGSSCFNTGEYENQNSFSFGNYLISGVKNPYRKFYTTWPASGSVSVSITVVDVDGINEHDSMGHKTRSFYQPTPDRNDALSTWNDFTFQWSPHHTHTITVRAEARVYCADYYYGSDCLTVCFPRDTDEHGHYTCSDTGAKVCREHYYGDLCMVRCVPQDSDSGHYTCNDNGQKICLNGWAGVNCDDDVDECFTASPCSPNGNCTNLEGSYTCDCDPAYTGTNCEEVKLFCDENPCSNNSVCNNTLGGYECICEDYWHGRHCDQEPYCTNNPCTNTSTCTNTKEGYVCFCHDGWQGQNCTEEITPCTSSPCLNGGVCSVQGDAYNCTCVGEWEGSRCQSEIREIFTDNRSIILVGQLNPDKEIDLKNGIKDVLIGLGIHNVTVDIESKYDGSENTTTVDITVSSHDPRIIGALQGIPENILAEYLPLPQASTGPAGLPTAQPVAGFKTDPWVKQHWYAILLIVLALIAIMAGLVIFMFVIKKRRTDKLQKSGFDHDQPVRPMNGATADAAIGFDNNLYYEIRHPETVEGLPNGKEFYD